MSYVYGKRENVMSFLFDIGGRRRKAVRLFALIHDELWNAFEQEAESRNLSQRQIAEKLGSNPSVINRLFSEKTNLTLRSIADLAWAMDYGFEFKLVKQKTDNKQNFFPEAAKAQAQIVKNSSLTGAFLSIPHSTSTTSPSTDKFVPVGL